MGDEVKTRSEQVNQGESLADFAKRTGTDPKKIVELNEIQMREHASARGFDHTFLRTTETDGKVTSAIDYHVFPGERLLVPDTKNKSKDDAVNEQDFAGSSGQEKK